MVCTRLVHVSSNLTSPAGDMGMSQPNEVPNVPCLVSSVVTGGYTCNRYM
jgi:hypothetical protein